jgi:hypothetical protein
MDFDRVEHLWEVNVKALIHTPLNFSKGLEPALSDEFCQAKVFQAKEEKQAVGRLPILSIKQ